MVGCCEWICVMDHSAMALRKIFSESIATHLRDGMTSRTGYHTIFCRAGKSNIAGLFSKFYYFSKQN